MAKISLVTPWSVSCGNADYAKQFFPVVGKKFDMKLVEIKNPYTKNPFYFWNLAKKSSKNCDIIHIQHAYGVFGKIGFTGIGVPFFYLGLDKSKKIITSLHDVGDFSSEGFSGFFRKIYRRTIDYFIYKYSDVLHVHTKIGVEYLIKHGADKRKVVYSPLGIFVEPKFVDKKLAKRKLGLENKTVLLLYGFIHANKGHDLAIESLKRLDKNIVLLVAGDCKDLDYLKKLEERVKELKLENRVIFYGRFEEKELPTIMAASDIALFPYRKITQSSALNMVAAYGLPAICSDLDFFKTIEKENGSVITFKADDVWDFAEKITRFAKGKEEYNKSKANIKKYVDRRSPEKVIRFLEGVYSK